MYETGIGTGETGIKTVVEEEETGIRIGDVAEAGARAEAERGEFRHDVCADERLPPFIK